MLTKTLAALAFTGSLVTAVAACQRPQIIAVPAATDPARPGQMTITGTATLEVSPDCADLTMTISADGAKPGLATTQVDAKEHALIAALGKLGVAGNDLKLSTLTLAPVYLPNPDGWAQITVHTYRATITVTATTRDFGKIASLMDAGAEAGASQMSSLFRRSDMPALKKQVRDMALKAAKDKAKQTADALGIGLGRVVSVAENAGGTMWSQAYFPQANASAVSNSGGSLGGELQPLTLDVTIGYEVAQDRKAS
jgi:uncharacterized protein YggE